MQIGIIIIRINEISRVAELLFELTNHGVNFSAELNGDEWVIETYQR